MKSKSEIGEGVVVNASESTGGGGIGAWLVGEAVVGVAKTLVIGDVGFEAISGEGLVPVARFRSISISGCIG